MPTLCRAYSTEQEAHAAVDRLLGAGTSDGDIRILMGRPVRDHRDDPVGGYAGPTGEQAGSFADAPQSSRAGAGSYAGDADEQRRGGFGDIDRETVTSYRNGVPHVQIASHRNLKRMLVEVGLDEATAETDVAALHHGRILVLVRTSDLTPEAAAQALDGDASVSRR
jgi:hypothetical protein